MTNYPLLIAAIISLFLYVPPVVGKKQHPTSQESERKAQSDAGDRTSADSARGRWVGQKSTTKALRFRLRVLTAGAGSDTKFAAEELQVIDRQTGRVLQAIDDIDGTGMYTEADRLLKVADANFDRHPDIVIAAADGGAGPNNTDYFYIYNPRRKRFEFDEELSSLTQVTINRNGTITSASRGSCCSHSSETYRYVRGRLTLISSWDESLTADGRWVETTTGRLRKGKMRYATTRRRATLSN